MPEFRFKGLGRYGDGPRKFIEDEFGFSPTKSGNDLIISDRQAARAFAGVDVLHIHPRLQVVKGEEWELAKRLYAQIPEDVKKYQIPPPKSVQISSEYGFISVIERDGTMLAIVPDQEVAACLAQEVIPAVSKCYGAKYVTGVSVNAHYQQVCISFSKVALLAQEHDTEDIEKMLQEHNPLGGALPSSLDILSYVDSLTLLSPIMFTLPFRREGCAWRFQSDGMYMIMSSDAVNGVAQQFMINVSPLADAVHFLGLEGLPGMDAQAVFRYLRFVVIGINRLMSHLNDPRNFVAEDNSVDFLMKVQAYTAVQLIFADLSGMNFSTYAHNRISYAMSAMDKLANLRWKLGGVQARELQLMIGLASLSQRDHLKALIREAAAALGYDELSNALGEAIDRCYDGLHEQLRRQCHGGELTEAPLLEKIWLQRNVRHGAFLRKRAFERLFLAADGTVASTIGSLPFLLALGLISDPARFLSFNPSVEGDLQ